MKALALPAIAAILVVAIFALPCAARADSAASQTVPPESWRYDHDASGAVTIADAILVLRHVGETYTLPGPCHAFSAFATPVILPDGTLIDGMFEDDLTSPPSRDYLTC